MSSDTATSRSEFATTLQIIPVVFFTFLCYLTIGIPLAVLPGYVHDDLGYSAILAGLAISVQYFATLASRPLAGRSADTLGPKKTVSIGLIGCGVSGVLLLLAVLCGRWPVASLTLLVLSRLVLGFGESLCGTGAILWGIGRVGTTNNARVISWNGIATYGALAIGAPLGVAIVHAVGFEALGFVIVALAALGYYLARLIAAVPLVHGERMSYRSVFTRVLPHGIGLALGSAGFGSIATFITLFYAARHWPDAALALTVFGTLFVGSRLLFANTIKTYGGFRVAIASFSCECVGLLLLRLRARVPGARRRSGRAGAAGEPRRGVVGLFGVSGSVAGHYRAARGLYRRRVRIRIGVSVRGDRICARHRAFDDAVSAPRAGAERARRAVVFLLR